MKRSIDVRSPRGDRTTMPSSKSPALFVDLEDAELKENFLSVGENILIDVREFAPLDGVLLCEN